MKIYKAMFHKIIEPVDSISLPDLIEAGERLKGSEGASDNISNAIGEVVLRIVRLRALADWVSRDIQPACTKEN